MEVKFEEFHNLSYEEQLQHVEDKIQRARDAKNRKEDRKRRRNNDTNGN